MATKKTIQEDAETELQEAPGAQDSLHPNSAPADNPKSKIEAMKAVISGIGAMQDNEWVSWFEKAMSLMTDVSRGAPNSADANKSTLNMHPSNAEGHAGPLPGQPMVKLAKEEIQKIFAGETLTEEAQESIATLFEAAVTARLEMERAGLEEQFEAKLTEEVEAFVTETKETLDDYVEYVANAWLEENQVAAVDTLRAENAEEFMGKLRELFVESYIDVPEDRLDVVREMTEKVEELEDALNKMINEASDLKRQIVDKEKTAVVAEACQGLTLVDQEKLKKLVENVEFKGDTEDYSKKVKLVRETYTGKASTETVPDTSGSVELSEQGELGTEKKEPVVTDQLIGMAAKLLEKRSY